MHILPLHFLIENPLVYLTARGRKRINGSAFEMKHCTVDLQTQKHFLQPELVYCIVGMLSPLILR